MGCKPQGALPQVQVLFLPPIPGLGELGPSFLVDPVGVPGVQGHWDDVPDPAV